MRNRENPGALSSAAAPPGDAITIELLGRGTHVRPSAGANVLELATVLAGETWDTSPESVHPALAAAAQTVNDLLDDDHRRLLVPLAPWLPGTRTSGAWAVVAGVCGRAAKTAARKPTAWTPIQADGNAVRELAAQAEPRPEKRRRWHWTHSQDRRKITDAVRAAHLSWAGSGSEAAAMALCQLLTDCINGCRKLAGERPVDPRLPLAACPSSLQVQLRHIWPPGCDWMSVGYEPIAALMPACLRRETAGAQNALKRSHPPAALRCEAIGQMIRAIPRRGDGWSYAHTCVRARICVGGQAQRPALPRCGCGACAEQTGAAAVEPPPVPGTGAESCRRRVLPGGEPRGPAAGPPGPARPR